MIDDRERQAQSLAVKQVLKPIAPEARKLTTPEGRDQMHRYLWDTLDWLNQWHHHTSLDDDYQATAQDHLYPHL